MELRLHTVASYFPVLRWLIIPFISLVIIHFFILHRLPFQQGYSFPWLTFLIVTGMGLVICEANVRINRWLTGRWSDDHSFGFRVTQQLAFGWLGTSLVFSALYFTVNVGLFGVEFDLVRFLGLLVLLLGISTMETTLFMVHEYHRLFRRHEGTEQSLPGQRSESPDYLLVRSGQRLLRIECEEIAFFHSSAGIVTLLTQDGQKWITDFPSLQVVEESLGDASDFFRLNRQYLVQVNSVRTIKEYGNRQLLVDLEPGLHNGHSEPAVVSRYRRKAFQEWLETQGN